MRLQIRHETRYRYAPAMAAAQHMAHLRPLDTPSQTVLAHGLSIDPEPAQIHHCVDVRGNTRSYLALEQPHRHLHVNAVSQVQTRALPPSHSSLTWEAARECWRYRAGQAWHAAGEYVCASPAIEAPQPDFAAYAAPCFAPGTPLCLAAQQLMARIHQDFAYTPQSTAFHTPAWQVLAQKRGVCQDFSHVMIACLRSLGLAARYVSGYVLTQPAAGAAPLRGADASHAWVSVCLPDAAPGADWCDFDPTNRRWGWGSPGQDYVQLALGRDVTDVSPLKGVLQGPGQQQLAVNVTLQALPETPDAGV